MKVRGVGREMGLAVLVGLHVWMACRVIEDLRAAMAVRRLEAVARRVLRGAGDAALARSAEARSAAAEDAHDPALAHPE